MASSLFERWGQSPSTFAIVTVDSLATYRQLTECNDLLRSLLLNFVFQGIFMVWLKRLRMHQNASQEHHFPKSYLGSMPLDPHKEGGVPSPRQSVPHPTFLYLLSPLNTP